jgi:hypothetical protein
VLLSFSGCGDRKRIENPNTLTTDVSSSIEKVGVDDRTNQVNKEEKGKFWSIVSNPVFLVTGTFIITTLLTSAVWYFGVHKPSCRKAKEALNFANTDKRWLKEERDFLFQQNQFNMKIMDSLNIKAIDALNILVKREGKTIKNLRSNIGERVESTLKTINAFFVSSAPRC